MATATQGEIQGSRFTGTGQSIRIAPGFPAAHILKDLGGHDAAR